VSAPAVPAEIAAVGYLLPAVVASSCLVVIALGIARPPDPGKYMDKAMFAVAVLVTTTLGLLFLRRMPKRTAGPGISLLATTGLLIGIFWVERPYLTHILWEGFGISVALLALGLTLVFWPVLALSRSSPLVNRALGAGTIVLCLADLVSFLRTLNFFPDAFTNSYVLNEVLAPVAGRAPDSSFLPQYVVLYGWLFVPLRHLFGPWALAKLTAAFLSCLSVGAIALAVLIARRSLPRGCSWLAAALVVPFTSVTVLHGAALSSPIGSYLEELPVRLFPAMLFSWISIAQLHHLRTGPVRAKQLGALGLLGGLIAWNSQDFGIAVVVSYTVVLLVARTRTRLGHVIAVWLAGLASGLAAYPIFLLLRGTPVRLSYFALFSRTYEGGFGAALVQVPGPVLVVLPLLLGATIVGWCLLLHQRHQPRLGCSTSDYPVLTLVFVGTWSCIGFLYYLNRSYASGQLQMLLMPCGVCLAALVSLCMQVTQAELPDRPDRVPLFSRLHSRTYFSLLPIALLSSLALAAALQGPNPWTFINDLAHPPQRATFSSELASLGRVRGAAAYVRRHGGSLGYFGENGNFISLVTGVPSLMLVDGAALATTSPVLYSDTCNYLRQHATKWLVTSKEASQLFGVAPCGLYRQVDVAGLPAGTLHIRL